MKQISKRLLGVALAALMIVGPTGQSVQRVTAQPAPQMSEESKEVTWDETEIPDRPLGRLLQTLYCKGGESLRATVQDWNGDSVPELFVTYRMPDTEIQRLEIWSEQDGSLRLLWADSLAAAGSNAQCGIRQVTMDGTAYLCVYGFTSAPGLYGGAAEYAGSIWYFTPRETAERGYLLEQHTIRYQFTGWDSRSPSCISSRFNSAPMLYLDGAETDWNTMRRWLDVFDASEQMLLHVGAGTAVGLPMEETVKQLAAASDSGKHIAVTPTMAAVLEVVDGYVQSGLFPENACRISRTDVTGDSVPELIIAYAWRNGDTCLEIWSESEDSLQLLWAGNWYTAAGGAKADIRVVSIDGESYLCLYNWNVSRGVETWNQQGTMEFLKWTADGGFRRAHRLEYVVPGPDNRTQKITEYDTEVCYLLDGRECGVDTFLNWSVCFDNAVSIFSGNVETPAGLTLTEVKTHLLPEAD